MSTDRLFAAAGDLQTAYASVDWSRTSLGPPGGWTPTLRAVFETMARTKFPCTLLWGREAVLLYNNEYVAVLGEKHPTALGGRAEDVFPEAWELVSGLLARVTANGEAVYLRDALVPLHRDGRLTDAFFTFCYSAVCGPGGQVEGVLDIVSETTREVLGARRLTLLDDLREATAGTEDAAVVKSLALRVLRSADDVRAAAFVRGGGRTVDPFAAARRIGDVELRRCPDGTSIARVPLEPTSGSTQSESLELTLNPTVQIDDDLLSWSRAVGATTSHALARLAHLAAEREIARQERGFSEALQTSLLGEPQVIGDLEVAVRYIPASDTSSVGGDWYDSIVVPSGALLLAIGDIAGHDRNAAVAMAQARNILRGIAFSAATTPARMLTSLDHAVTGLSLTEVLTAVVASLDPVADDGPAGTRTMHWSNAGHPPPAMVAADGTVTFLQRQTEPLLGLGFSTTRHDHSVSLARGTTVVFFTDGLVERRDEDLDTGLERLRNALVGSQHLEPDAVIEALVDMAGAPLEDDVAIVVLRIGAGGVTEP